jgi:hypothetical protein
MSAHDGSRTTGPNYAAAVDGPSGPSLPPAVGDASVRNADDPSEANIESYLRRSFKPVANVA